MKLNIEESVSKIEKIKSKWKKEKEEIKVFLGRN